MKEITVESIKSFIACNNIPFIATQNKLCIPIIVRMCRKMSYGIKFEEIKVCDNLIIDGHHRYLSALMMTFDLGRVESNKTSATKSVQWGKVEFDEHDWDSAAGIVRANERDAMYNDLEIEYIKQIVQD